MPYKDLNKQRATIKKRYARIREELNAKRRANRAADPEKFRQQERQYRDKNHEVCLERERAYRRKNSARIYTQVRASIKKAKERNPEQFLEKQRVHSRRHRLRHPERVREACRRSVARHPETSQRHNARRKARKIALPDTFTHEQQQFMLQYWGYACAVCGNQEGFQWTLSLEHWIALSSPDCPGTIATNMLPLCHGIGGCNTSKRHKPAYEWLLQCFGPRKAKAIAKKIATYFTIVAERFSTHEGLSAAD